MQVGWSSQPCPRQHMLVLRQPLSTSHPAACEQAPRQLPRPARTLELRMALLAVSLLPPRLLPSPGGGQSRGVGACACLSRLLPCAAARGSSVAVRASDGGWWVR